jgi:hypothetical protein
MASEASKSATSEPSADTSVVEDAANAAAGLRSTARWVASALAAIPSLAILATLFKPPEGTQFDEGRLFVALMVAAAAAILGIVYLSRVLKPAQLRPGDLDGFDMRELPGAPFSSIDELRRSIEGAQRVVAVKRVLVDDAEADVALAKSHSDQAKAALEAVEKLLKENPSDPGLQELAAASRDAWSKLDLVTAAESAKAASAARVLKGQEHQLNARLALLRDAYRLKTTDIVASRYREALYACGASLLAIGFAVFLLLTAPKKAQIPFTPTLVKLNLSEEGMRALGCDNPDVAAIQIAETDDGPRVITLPQEGCPSVVVVFKSGDDDMGELKEVPSINE